MFFLVCHHLSEDMGAGCFTAVLLNSCLSVDVRSCSMSLPLRLWHFLVILSCLSVPMLRFRETLCRVDCQPNRC